MLDTPRSPKRLTLRYWQTSFLSWKHPPGNSLSPSEIPSSTTAALIYSKPETSASGWRCGGYPSATVAWQFTFLTDVGGSTEKSFVEETEIMAFDLFWDGPHYHYGPRNKNHRIYWDRTLVTDYLGWVLDKIDGKKLGAMIERAGYPGIAADLDQDMIDAVLPALTTKAREMLALGESLTGHPGLPADVTPNLVTN